jgi:transcription elongation factor SPT6
MFSLGFKANREAPIQRWPVRVLPGRFKLRDADQLPDVNSLCEWYALCLVLVLRSRLGPSGNSFKTQYTTQASAARGGRTPGHLGAATPRGALGQSYGNYGGATPAGAATPGRYGAYGGAGGATPMAGGLASRTPYGAGMAAAPARTPMQYPVPSAGAPRPGAPPGPPPRMPPPSGPMGYGAPPPGMGMGGGAP